LKGTRIIYMYLSPKIFKWEVSSSTIRHHSDFTWKQAYVIWSHANEILNVSNNYLFCVDAVSTLKRAIDHRIKLLFEIYRFKDIPIKEKPSGHYEILHHFGIIRSRMLKKLIEIRNKIEHEGAFPPDEETCRDYTELTWYFLRSTDFLVRQVTGSLNFKPQESDLDPKHYGVSFEIDPYAGWIPRVFAWVESNMISKNPKDGWGVVKVDRTTTRKALMESTGRPIDPGDWDLGRGKLSDDIHISGEIRGTSVFLDKIYQIYFETL